MTLLTLPRLRTPSTLVLGGALLVLIGLAAIVGIWFTPYDPTAFSVRERLQPPSALHPFGTDEFGRDVLSRVLAGAHLSLATGFGAMVISLAAGVPLGAVLFRRARRHRRGDAVIDLLIAIPPVLLGLLVLAVTPPSLGKTIAAVGLVYVPIMVRLTRAVALGLLEEDFVQAARARGRGSADHPVARDPAQCLAAAHRRVRPARDLRHPARRQPCPSSVSAPSRRPASGA